MGKKNQGTENHAKGGFGEKKCAVQWKWGPSIQASIQKKKRCKRERKTSRRNEAEGYMVHPISKS